MNFGLIIEEECVNTAPPADSRCQDPAFALLNPDICPPQPQLIVTPGSGIVCALGSIQFKSYYVVNGVQTDVTADTVFTSSDMNVAVVGASTGSATGVAAGEATISATYQGKTALSELTVLAGTNCCDQINVAMLLLVDTTLSMSRVFNGSYPTRLDYAKAAAAQFIGEVNGLKDSVGIMTFTGIGESLLIAPTNSTAAAAAQVPNIVQSGEKTQFYDAVVAAIAELNVVASDRKVLVIMSDGEDTLTGSYTQANDPLVPLQAFKDAGGIVVVLGVRASGQGFSLLNAMATGGFFINAYDSTAAAALGYLSGLKGYTCAGNCTPEGDVMVAEGALEYDAFTYWDVTGGTVDLLGNGFFDFLPGNGLYVDLIGVSGSNGSLVTKTAIALTSGHTYSLTAWLAGNQLVSRAADTVKLRVFWVDGGGGEHDVLNQSVNVATYSLPFTPFSFSFTANSNYNVFISIQQTIVPTTGPADGVLLNAVKFEDSTDLTTLLDDDFDSENLTYVPPRCGVGTTWVWLPDLSSYGYAEGENCYGTGCLDTPPPVQLPDPSPLSDIESGYTPPKSYTSTKNVCVSCPAGSENAGAKISPTITGQQGGSVGTFPAGQPVWATASSEINSVEVGNNDTNLPYAWYAFDDNDATYWASDGDVPQWLGVKLAAATTAYSYSLKPLPVGKPTAWKLQGSNDAVTWTDLDTQSGANLLVALTDNRFTIASPGSYMYYRINVTAVNSCIQLPGAQTCVNRVGMVAFELFGSPAAEVCADGTGTSDISQADADSKAIAAATLAAQALLDCVVVYTSTQQYTATCPPGQFGPTVTKTATATSYVSQADADQKALAEATAAAVAELDCGHSNNTQAIDITDFSPATPYPSVEVITGGPASISHVAVNLHGFTHQNPSDVRIVLMSPSGTAVLLMGNVADGFPASALELVIDDAGAAMPAAGALASATYAPTDFTGGVYICNPPGPLPPYGNALSDFNGEDANGSWSLWVEDVVTLDVGQITSGWDLTIT